MEALLNIESKNTELKAIYNYDFEKDDSIMWHFQKNIFHIQYLLLALVNNENIFMFLAESFWMCYQLICFT